MITGKLDKKGQGLVPEKIIQIVLILVVLVVLLLIMWMLFTNKGAELFYKITEILRFG